jgi:hypothetical protein
LFYFYFLEDLCHFYFSPMFFVCLLKKKQQQHPCIFISDKK